MSYKNLVRPTGKFHPEQVANFSSSKVVALARSFTKNKYGNLTDKSTYAEYAWEFLRRNKFYQALIDAHTDDKVPHYPLPSWGYRQNDTNGQSSEWDYHCGLWREPYKHYSEAYTTDITWYPIEYMRQTMCGKLGRTTALEDTSTQLHITIDLGHKFGPNVSGLKKQLEIAEQAIIAIHSKLSGTQDYFAQLETHPIKKSILRRYLYVADLYTQLESEKKKPAESWTDYIANNLKKVQPKFSETDVNKCAKSAFEYIYQWHCLGLLTLVDKSVTEDIEHSEAESTKSDGGLSLQTVWS